MYGLDVLMSVSTQTTNENNPSETVHLIVTEKGSRWSKTFSFQKVQKWKQVSFRFRILGKRALYVQINASLVMGFENLRKYLVNCKGQKK